MLLSVGRASSRHYNGAVRSHTWWTSHLVCAHMHLHLHLPTTLATCSTIRKYTLIIPFQRETRYHPGSFTLFPLAILCFKIISRSHAPMRLPGHGLITIYM